MLFLPSYQLLHAESLSINSENTVFLDLVERALNLELLATNETESAEADQLVKSSFDDGVMKGDYQKAFKIIMNGIAQFPEDFNIQTTLAVLLGDFSNHFSGSLKARMIEKSKELFTKLLPELKNYSKHTYYWFMNEYYYRFGNFKEQYELGAARVNENLDNRGFRGYYGQGVGAANYAKKQLLQGNKKIAYEYAQKALVVWAQYFTHANDYYNAYVHFSVALAILGFKDEALKALEHATSLIKKDHVEFQEVRDFIDSDFI
jgi:tetratricopeptide (TPR) repeat protein